MKNTNPVITFIQKLSFFQMCILYVNSYNLKCPSQANWKLRSYGKCDSTLKYFCLFNNVKRKYVEGCSGPDWDRRGSKRIYARDFTRDQCIHNRFQPFKFWTNESMSDCVYTKSICSEDGQIVHADDSTKIDRACRCDYTKKYSFNKVPRNVCFCIPTEEDCSCYIKSCTENLTLSPDYECTKSDFQEITKCTVIIKQNKTRDSRIPILQKNHLPISKQVSKLNWRDNVGPSIVFCLCLLVIIVGFLLAVLFPIWTFQPQILKIDFWRKESERSDDSELGTYQDDLEVHQPSNRVELTPDECNFLRLIHLLFRVACPVVRMTFNQEIQPNQLRKTLDKNKVVIRKIKNRTKMFDDNQWDLLFKNTREKPLSSENFGIELMINLLSSLTNINVGDIYPVRTDSSIGAMLTRIKCINEVIKNGEGKLSESMFNQYWENLGQAILNLVSTNMYHIQADEDNRNLIDRLITLNPIHFDHDKLSEFIVLSENNPAMILHQIIFEYCKKNRTCVEEILTCERHQLYHKRIKAESCCVCPPEFSTYLTLLSEKEWNSMYEHKPSKRRTSHSHECTSKQCIENFIPKTIDTFDLSVTAALVLSIPNILQYIMKRLFIKGFDKFLMNNTHALFHSMEKRKCCLCKSSPTDKILLNQKEWNKLFQKRDKVPCTSIVLNCHCQFSVREGIEYSNLDEHFLLKIFHVAGPFSVLNKIKQDPFLYFLNWNLDDTPLQVALVELSNIIKDKTCGQRIPIINSPHMNKAVTEYVDTSGWIARHTDNKKETTQPDLVMLVLDKDGVNVKCVQIPNTLPLPARTKFFTDVTPEENNFLLVVYNLTNIVYPAIKRQFETNMCMDSGWKERENFHLSQHDEFQLMIYYLQLKSKNENLGFDIKHLDEINAIRREIVESCTGILDEPKSRNILNRIITGVKSVSKNICMEELPSFKHIADALGDKSLPQMLPQIIQSTNFLEPKIDEEIANKLCIEEATKKRNIIDTSEKELTKHVEAVFQQLDEVQTCIYKMNTNLEMCRPESECIYRFKRMRSHLTKIYNQQLLSSQKHIMFSGIPERNEKETSKQTEDILKTFMRTEMKMNPIMDFTHAKRFGNKTKNKDEYGNQYITRPIICKFRQLSECKLVISKARVINSTKFVVTEVFPNEDNDR